MRKASAADRPARSARARRRRLTPGGGFVWFRSPGGHGVLQIWKAGRLRLQRSANREEVGAQQVVIAGEDRAVAIDVRD